jgi:hypothetical protein
MYFFNLPAFHPTRGINTDNHRNYPFIESIDGLFEPNDQEFDFRQSFPFELIDLNEGQQFYISEPNLLKVFRNVPIENNRIRVNNVTAITEDYTKEVAKIFYEGYSAGITHFFDEIGQTFLSLSLDNKKEVLKNLIIYCHTNLYFEGFAIPKVLYALGYMQGCMVKGFQEYSNLEVLIKRDQGRFVWEKSYANGEAEPEVKSHLSNEKDFKTDIIQQKAREEASFRIPLRYPAIEIFDLWCGLLDYELCSQMQVPHVFNTEDEIKSLLGRLFETEGQQQIWSRNNSKFYYEIAPGYQNLLCLLMHATYKLNGTYVKVPQIKYCELLKLNFSPFQTIESVGDIQSNMTKKKDSAIELVHKSNGSYTKKAYEILKKIPSYRLKD